jgi:integrase/recombinase XerC
MKKNKEIQIYKKNEIDIKQTAWNSLSGESRKAYQSDFKMFFDFIKKPADKIVANDILLYIEYLKEQNYKNSSINRKTASLSKLFKIMVLAGEIKNNPVDSLKQFKNISFKTNKEIKTSLTMQDIKTAIKNPKKNEEKIVIIIRMLVKTGLRISEMINIKNEDIEKYDNNNYIIRIVGKGDKERFIFIELNFLNKIKKIFPDIKSDYLFYNRNNNPLSRMYLWRMMKDFFFKKIGKKVHPHLLRHAYITQKISVEKQDIKAVSRYAGHADVSTTLNMYVDTALDVNKAKIKI